MYAQWNCAICKRNLASNACAIYFGTCTTSYSFWFIYSWIGAWSKHTWVAAHKRLIKDSKLDLVLRHELHAQHGYMCIHAAGCVMIGSWRCAMLCLFQICLVWLWALNVFSCCCCFPEVCSTLWTAKILHNLLFYINHISGERSRT